MWDEFADIWLTNGQMWDEFADIWLTNGHL